MSLSNQLLDDFFSPLLISEQVKAESSVQQEYEVEEPFEIQQLEQLPNEEDDLYQTHFSINFSSFEELIASISSFQYRYYDDVYIADGWLNLTCDSVGKYFHLCAPINESQQEEFSTRVNKEYLTHQELLAVAQATIRSCIINKFLVTL